MQSIGRLQQVNRIKHFSLRGLSQNVEVAPVADFLAASRVFSEGGRRLAHRYARQCLLDGFAGIAVNAVGHNHPRLVSALQKQVSELIHVSNYFRIDLQEEVAAKLCEKSGLRGCFFCNSGLEANEAAIKLARKYGHLKGFNEPKIIVFDHAFHGRSIATLSATGNPNVRRDFAPYLPDFIRVPAGDVELIEKLASTTPGICAVMFEPVQGEGGIIPIPDERCEPFASFAIAMTG